MGYFLSLQPCQIEQQVESCWLSSSHSASGAGIKRVDEGQSSATPPACAASALAHCTGLKPAPTAVKVKFWVVLVLFFFFPSMKRKYFPNSLQASKYDFFKKKGGKKALARFDVDIVQLLKKPYS